MNFGAAFRLRVEAMPTVEFTRHLHAFFPQLRGQAMDVPGSTVAEVLRAIEQFAPGFLSYVCDERGRLRPHVNVFVEEERVVDREQLSDRVEPHTQIFVLQSLSGG